MKSHNTNNKDLNIFIKKFLPYAEKKLGFNKPPTINFQDDLESAKDIFGKTAYYEPDTYQIVLFTTGRHPKDILRSLSHELVHHTQNCRGDFQNMEAAQEGYAQNDPHLRKMEKEAYLYGNIIFRDFCDSQLHETSYNKGDNTMTEDTLREAINKAIKKATRGSKKTQEQLKTLLEGSDTPAASEEDLEESTEEDVIEEAEDCVVIQRRYERLLDAAADKHSVMGQTLAPEYHDMASQLREENPQCFGETGVSLGAPAAPEQLQGVTHFGESKEKSLKEEGLGGEPVNCEEIIAAQEAQWEEAEEMSQHYPGNKSQMYAAASKLYDKHPECWEKKKTTVQSTGEFGGLGESKEKPLKEWYGNSLYKKLVKEYTRRK